MLLNISSLCNVSCNNKVNLDIKWIKVVFIKYKSSFILCIIHMFHGYFSFE